MIIRELRPLYDSKGTEYKIVDHIYGKNEYFILEYGTKRTKISRKDLETAIAEKRIKQTAK